MRWSASLMHRQGHISCMHELLNVAAPMLLKCMLANSHHGAAQLSPALAPLQWQAVLGTEQ